MSSLFPSSSSCFEQLLVLKPQILKLLNYINVCLTFPPEMFFWPGILQIKIWKILHKVVGQLVLTESQTCTHKKKTKYKTNSAERNDMKLKSMESTLNYRKAFQ